MTETSQLVPNGDGTLTLEMSSVPVRVRRDTAWVPVDTTLQVTDSGAVAPVAVARGLVLSGGGSQLFAQLSRDGVKVAWSWPTALPCPRLEADSAVYSEVLAGVDLRVTATETGFSEVLVVKSAHAAGNPALSRLVLKSTVTGGAISRRGDGGLDVKITGGSTVLAGATPLVWDIVGPAVASAVEGPTEGDHTALVTATPSATEVTIVPDLGVLRGQGTVYPVMIDPSLRIATPTTSRSVAPRTMGAKSFPTTSYWNWPGTSPNGDAEKSEGMGYFDGMVKRLLWQYNVGTIAGKNIISAEFAPTERGRTTVSLRYRSPFR